MTNEDFARKLMKQGDVFTREDVYCFVEETAKWKDEQNTINNAHLNMLYDALDKLYQKKYQDSYILDTGSQTDVYLKMIDNLINEIK